VNQNSTSARVRLFVTRRLSWTVAVTALLLFTAPQWAPSYLNGPIQLIAVYVIVSLGVSITLGFAGQFTLGYGAVFAAGAYTSALLISDAGWPVWSAFLAAVVVGGAIGTVLGLPALRLKSHYLAMVTLGFAVIVPELIRAWDSVTHGFAGVGGIERISFGSGELSSDAFYYVVAVAAVLMLWLAHNLLSSLWRNALLAVHGDELAAAALAVPVYRVKVVAFLIASVLAGFGGALYASYIGFVSPDTFTVELSILFLTIIVIGGEYHIAGPVIGAAFFVLLPQYLAAVRDYSVVIYGATLVVAPMLIPNGMVGVPSQLRSGWRRLRGRGTSEQPVAGTRPAAAAVTAGLSMPPLEGHSPGEGLLEATGITKRFGGITALSDVDLRVRGGTIHALIGPNGSGKTTLLNVLSGIYPPEEGQVVLGGDDVSGRPVSVVARNGLGRTFQTPRLFRHLTVVENVEVALFHDRSVGFLPTVLQLPAATRSRLDQRQAAEGLLAFVGLADYADSPATSLPLGKARLLEVARALAANPGVVLLDEPAAGLAGEDLDALSEMIVRLRDLRYGVVLVEHHVEMVFELADEVTVLQDGRTIATGRPEQVQIDTKVQEAYLGAP